MQTTTRQGREGRLLHNPMCITKTLLSMERSLYGRDCLVTDANVSLTCKGEGGGGRRSQLENCFAKWKTDCSAELLIE